MLRITALHVRDFKRIREINLTPGERALVLIGGNNAQGKSSLLDALTAALGGKRQQPTDPVRHGAGAAEIRVEFNGGALVVRRVMKPGGSDTLTVTEDGAQVRSPQALLDALIGARFLDPLAFLALPAAAQRASLLDIIDADGAIAKLEGERLAKYTERTDVGRDLKRAEGHLSSLPDVKPAERIDVAEQQAVLDGALAQVTLIAGRRQALDEARRRYTSAKTDVERLRTELAAAEGRQAAALADGNAISAELKADDAVAEARAGRIERMRTTIGAAGEHNARVTVDEISAQRRVQAAADVERLRAERDRLTAAIEDAEARKSAQLAAAALPVAGLSVDPDQILLNSVPLSQASGAERLRVALGLAAAASPNIGDVWIRDGALLDDNSLALVGKMAADAGRTIWCERVGDDDEGAIIVEDGGIR